MKDQVDALQANGVAAAFLNSSQSSDEQRQIAQQVRQGELKLLYLAPERLLTDRMLDYLQSARVSMFAIDEAHCISDWGHDFRPEYRGLRVLKERFPKIPVHAFTATAPEHVRRDIAAQLGLDDAVMLIGTFDRPNLIYRMQPIDGRLGQVVQVINRHRRESGGYESGIVYCISRKEVESTAGALNELGVKALPYHAGLDDATRKRNQEAFIRDEADVIVATVAFGMGIDKPDVRYVVHAGMPKSVENYQQESGRAGRDGLESECVLLYGSGEVMTWLKMFQSLEGNARQAAERSLRAMQKLCNGATCRHRALSEYFGQELPSDNCGACDVCLSEIAQVDDPITLGQKILSCVLRLDQRFGADHTAKVLLGSTDQQVLHHGHDRLSTYGLLKEESLSTIRNWIDQLIGQQFLSRQTEFQTLRVTDKGVQLLKRALTPVLTLPPQKKSASKSTAAQSQSWEGVDRGLFEHLRQTRADEARKRSVPAYIVFGDATLRELARIRPDSLAQLRRIKGVGEQKLADFGQVFLDAMEKYCADHSLERNVVPVFSDTPTNSMALPASPSTSAISTFKHWREGASIDEVVALTGRASSTVSGYLSEYLQTEGITDPSPWVPAEDVEPITKALSASVDGRLKPIFDALEGKYSYESIRVVRICHLNATKSAT